MFGRRPDGRRIKGIDPIVQVTPYIMPQRSDAQVFLKHRADMEAMSEYIKKVRQEKGINLTHMDILAAAYVRGISKNPHINRFIMNKQYYSRNNCSMALTILKDPKDLDKGETVIKTRFDLTDTIFDVHERIETQIRANRGDQPKNFLDKLAAFVFMMPGLPNLIVGLVKLLDRYGLCPKFMIDELPFHVGLYITNMASIGLHDVNHHIYNFGNVSLFFGMGLPEKEAVVENGVTRMKRYLPIGITADERVCGGAHYAQFFRDMRFGLDHPESLEVPPTEVKFDHGLEYHEPKPERTEK
ncbi:MAG: 2-oxo acid dehydrogenase subunit E2 [Firmicutes bacterium]|nr:2-oxo acid dehydrogenase subunit E2 [Bacillota bacterium]